jgi:uncharacterized protein involved in exopolysaccharide biosynthesis
MAEPLGPFDAAPAGNTPAQNQVDWKRIFHIVRNYFWIVLLTCAAGISLAFFVTKKQTPL